MIIVLMGYMASGKSTIGKRLAKKLNYNFIDLDDLIESKENASVSEVFKSKGEIYFRKQEALYLREQLQSKEDIILSVGGGTPCYSNNMDAILGAENVKSVYLKASIPTLIEKLMKKKATRPLIAHIETEEAMGEFIGKHLFERAYYYNQANVKVSIDGRSKKEVTKDVFDSLF
ncbi:shikimate kinase [Algibacter lectus]|uniref:Shikimate kinase n=1 Tax=Algibacter lectus TaxID=221126 RepID=A0A090VI87_9FLAO|nr:shikimate kinase [Algibacter lectus]MDO7138770.1 shikimate kinase [Algibacter lectus]GAL63044.1 shikimate kinase I [Algibacter lectus]